MARAHRKARINGVLIIERRSRHKKAHGGGTVGKDHFKSGEREKN
jgi:hypothetical protein